MSNRSRRQRASVRRQKSRLSADERLRTVELYARLRNSNRVGVELGISGVAVRDRLYTLDVPLRPVGHSDVAAHWLAAVYERLAALRAEAKR